MPRTVQDVLTQARALLQDTRDPTRYADAELVRNLDEAISEARRLRPDLFVGRIRDGVALLTGKPLTTPLPIDDMLFTATVNYVVGRAEIRDDQFTTDGRAVTLITMFQGALLGGLK